MQVYLTTTGSPNYLVLDGFEFKHPVVRKPLIEPEGFMSLEEFRNSTQFPAAVAANQIILIDDDDSQITDGDNVTQGAIAVFEDRQGKNLIDSRLVLSGNVVQAPYEINLTGEGCYKQDGESIHARDKQTRVLLDEIDTSSTNPRTMISLTTKNLVDSLYNISFEGLIWTNRNNRYMGLGLYFNGEEQDEHYITPRINRANDHRTYKLSADFVLLEPETLVEVKWERVGSSVTLECSRRKLTIEQVLS